MYFDTLYCKQYGLRPGCPINRYLKYSRVQPNINATHVTRQSRQIYNPPQNYWQEHEDKG